MSAPSIPPSKQNSSSNRRPSTHPSSDSQATSVNISGHRPIPSASMFGGSTTDDLPPPNYAEATASSADVASAGR
ncbi:hypothetical protein BC629DRAFT_529103 [Irpex lacteus]|nr:hypothetical protein BC629DRAFT_529103 [Irpex lacteus]